MPYDTEYYRQWRIKNWDRRKAYSREKIVCDICNAKITRGSKHLHVKSKKHLNAIK